jgi:carboxypeptidase Q
MRRSWAALGLAALAGCVAEARPPSARSAAIAPDTASAESNPYLAAGEPVPSAAAETAPTAAPSPPDDVEKLQENATSGSRAYDIVRSLTDEVGPRPAGSRADRAAVAWATKTLAAAGLQNVHTERVMVPHWERGVETAELLGASGPQTLRVTALGGSTATPPAGLEADVVEVDSLAALEKLGAGAVRGKIVFINAPMRRTRDFSGYGDAVSVRFKGARVAQPLGALGVVIRSLGTDHDRLPHTGSKAKDDVEIPAAALSIPDADLLHRVLVEKKSARLHLVLTPRWLPDAESANVVGEVVGRERPDEIVLLGAHLDSWDLGTGAVDDGAGCAVVIEAGRVIAALPRHPRRTVRVVLFANEEHGRAGAKEYARAHSAEADKMIVAMEADMGTDRAYSVRYLGSEEGKGRFLGVAYAATVLGVATGFDDAESGADVALLRALGVPILEIRQDATRYFDVHHSANDTLDKIDRDALASVAATYATVAYQTSEMDGDFGRVPDDKRKEK